VASAPVAAAPVLTRRSVFDLIEHRQIEHRQTLAPLLAALPERERWILLLRFFDGLTQAEIGALVESPRCTCHVC
jgi:DNA-directed RNA polymerase specialized sigma subunit